MRTTLLACLLAGALGIGCGRPDEGGGWTVLGEQLSDAQTKQSDQAYDARDELFATLFARLKVSLQEHGAAASIDVCKSAAPKIAAAMNTKHDLKIGRTSFRLRNQGNAAPAWAHAHVEAFAKAPAEALANAPMHLSHADGRLAVLLPIRLMSGCAACHGPTDQIAPEVHAALAEHYPTDKATGFRIGDVRGWFWVEVPAR